MRKRVFVLAVLLVLAVPAVADARIVVGREMFGVTLGATMKQVRHTLGVRTGAHRLSRSVVWDYSRLDLKVDFEHGVVRDLSTQDPKQRTVYGVGVGSSELEVRRLVPDVVCSPMRDYRGTDCVAAVVRDDYRSRTDFQIANGVVDSVVMSSAVVASPGCAQSGSTTTCTYLFTGTDQTFVVPQGVTSLQVVLIGGHGGSAEPGGPHTGPGGSGAVVAGTLPVAGGTTLYVDVGGNGGNGSQPIHPMCLYNPPPCSPPCHYSTFPPCYVVPSSPGAPGGFNGGGAGGGGDPMGSPSGSGGGGFSDIGWVPATDGYGALSSMLVVAAGGGGAPGIGSQEEAAGGDAGQAGTGFYTPAAVGGGAGTATAGGAGGHAPPTCPLCVCPSGPSYATGSCYGSPGTYGSGGKGGADNGPGGGGGGGGWYGGGGGANAAGGGGGSSRVAYGFTASRASPDAAPEITISY